MARHVLLTAVLYPERESKLLEKSSTDTRVTASVIRGQYSANDNKQWSSIMEAIVWLRMPDRFNEALRRAGNSYVGTAFHYQEGTDAMRDALVDHCVRHQVCGEPRGAVFTAAALYGPFEHMQRLMPLSNREKYPDLIRWLLAHKAKDDRILLLSGSLSAHTHGLCVAAVESHGRTSLARALRQADYGRVY